MVAEAAANNYSGYNLDWELGHGDGAPVGSEHAASFVAFANKFKAQLGGGLLLSIDIINSNIDGTYCSNNNAYLDFEQLAASSIDRFIMEDYTAKPGGASSSCQIEPLNHSAPVGCDNSFTGQLNLVCSGGLPADKVVIGLLASSTGSNPIVGHAMTQLESYGFTKVAVFPEAEQSGDYTFLSSNGLVTGLDADQSDWFNVLRQFLSVPLAPPAPPGPAVTCDNGTVGTCLDATFCCSTFGYCYNDCKHCCASYYSGPKSAFLSRRPSHTCTAAQFLSAYRVKHYGSPLCPPHA